MFCSEELSCLPYKKQNKSLKLNFAERKFKFAALRGFFYIVVIPLGYLYRRQLLRRRVPFKGRLYIYYITDVKTLEAKALYILLVI